MGEHGSIQLRAGLRRIRGAMHSPGFASRHEALRTITQRALGMPRVCCDQWVSDSDGYRFVGHELSLSGWALPHSEIREVAVTCEDGTRVVAQRGLHRADVARAFPTELGADACGWTVELDTRRWGVGGHRVTITATDRRGRTASVERVIEIDHLTHVLADVPTSMTRGEVEALRRHAAGKRVVEIGAWHGHSTIAMASVAESVLSIDWHKGDAHAGFISSVHPYFANIDRSGFSDGITSVVGRVEDVVPLLRDDSFDFAFVDGYHTYDQVAADAAACARIVKAGGYIAFHDYGRFPDAKGGSMVTNAVDEFAARQGSAVERHDVSVAVVRLGG